MQTIHIGQGEALIQGKPCDCGCTGEIASIDHHKITGNKIVKTICRDCSTQKSLSETFRKRY